MSAKSEDQKIGVQDFYITDHAVLRYLERHHRLFNLKEVRKEIRDLLKDEIAPHTNIKGFKVTKTAVATYIPQRSEGGD